MEHLSVKKAINLARNFGAAGVLAAALVMTSGCSQADDRQTAVQVADSDNAQEDGVYGKMEYSVTGVEVHDSSAGDGGKVAVVRWPASLRKGLRREANATVCRFLTSTTCLPSK